MSRPEREPDETNTEHDTGNPNLDPPPTASDADLAPGGGVLPGRTPPESNSATASPPNPPPRRPAASKSGIILGAVLVIAVGLIFVAYAAGLLG